MRLVEEVPYPPTFLSYAWSINATRTTTLDFLLKAAVRRRFITIFICIACSSVAKVRILQRSGDEDNSARPFTKRNHQLP